MKILLSGSRAVFLKKKKDISHLYCTYQTNASLGALQYKNTIEDQQLKEKILRTVIIFLKVSDCLQLSTEKQWKTFLLKTKNILQQALNIRTDGSKRSPVVMLMDVRVGL